MALDSLTLMCPPLHPLPDDRSQGCQGREGCGPVVRRRGGCRGRVQAAHEADLAGAGAVQAAGRGQAQAPVVQIKHIRNFRIHGPKHAGDSRCEKRIQIFFIQWPPLNSKWCHHRKPARAHAWQLLKRDLRWVGHLDGISWVNISRAFDLVVLLLEEAFSFDKR